MQSEIEALPLVYISGQLVEPGIYRDLSTGALVRILEPSELPHEEKIVRATRLFRRVEEDDSGYRPAELVESGR